MTCGACLDLGILPVDYKGEPQHYALCLCPVGETWRKATNCGKPCNPLWHVWAARFNIPHERIMTLEDYATPQELIALGFTELTAPADALGAIASAARSRGGKRR